MTAPIGTQLREYTAYFDGFLDELTVDDILTERVATGPVQPLQPRRPVSRRGWVVAAGVAAAIIALIGAVALVLRSDALSTPPATEPPPLPGGDTTPLRLADSGSFESPLGALRWSRYRSESGPDLRLADSPQGGLVAWSIESGTVWTSEDGVQWNVTTLSVPVRAESIGVRRIGESYWMQTAGPTTLWTSGDLATWEEIDLAPIPLPDSFNVAWTIRLEQLTEAGSGVVVGWSVAPAVSGVAIDAFAGTHVDVVLDLRGLGFGIGQPPYEVRGTRITDGVEEVIAVVEIVPFGEGAGAWEIIDADTGDDYAYFAFETGGAFVDPLFYSKSGLLVIDAGGEAELVEPPWASGAATRVSIVNVQGRLLALVDSGLGDGVLRLWQSEDDGRSWESSGRPAFLPPGAASASLTQDDGALYLFVSTEGTEEQWISYEGSEWFLLPSPVRASSERVKPFAGGYGAWSADTLWLSADGVEWDEYDLADFGLTIDLLEFDGGFTGGLVGDRLFVRVWSDEPGGEGQVLILETIS